jgi:hypothetical protein
VGIPKTVAYAHENSYAIEIVTKLLEEKQGKDLRVVLIVLERTSEQRPTKKLHDILGVLLARPWRERCPEDHGRHRRSALFTRTLGKSFYSLDLQKQRDQFALAMGVRFGKDGFQLIARRFP